MIARVVISKWKDWGCIRINLLVKSCISAYIQYIIHFSSVVSPVTSQQKIPEFKSITGFLFLWVFSRCSWFPLTVKTHACYCMLVTCLKCTLLLAQCMLGRTPGQLPMDVLQELDTVSPHGLAANFTQWPLSQYCRKKLCVPQKALFP